jgi:hypothetical protein
MKSSNLAQCLFEYDRSAERPNFTCASTVRPEAPGRGTANAARPARRRRRRGIVIRDEGLRPFRVA